MIPLASYKVLMSELRKFYDASEKPTNASSPAEWNEHLAVLRLNSRFQRLRDAAAKRELQKTPATKKKR